MRVGPASTSITSNGAVTCGRRTRRSASRPRWRHRRPEFGAPVARCHDHVARAPDRQRDHRHVATGSSIRETLVSIAGSVRPPAFEIVVVSNGAGDASRAAIADSGVDVRRRPRGQHRLRVRLQRRRGRGVSRCRVPPVLQRRRRRRARHDPQSRRVGGAPPRRAARGRRRRSAPERGRHHPGGRLPGAGRCGTLQFGAGPRSPRQRQQGLLRRREIDYGSGAALLIRRDAFIAPRRVRPSLHAGVLRGRRPRLPPAVGRAAPRSSSRPRVPCTAPVRRPRRSLGSASSRPAAREPPSRARWAQTLADAPDGDDPVDDALPGTRVGPRTTTRSRCPTVARRMVVARGDHAGLRVMAEPSPGRLRVGGRTRRAPRSMPTREEARPATERAAEIGRRAAELSERLNELEHRGIVGSRDGGSGR